jgi:flagellar hook assembly protein FlgD
LLYQTFIPSVSIEFEIDEPTNININIYDLKGRFVESINYGYATIGNHSFLWNSKDLASGTYIVSIFNGKISSNRKITLIK